MTSDALSYLGGLDMGSKMYHGSPKNLSPIIKEVEEGQQSHI